MLHTTLITICYRVGPIYKTTFMRDHLAYKTTEKYSNCPFSGLALAIRQLANGYLQSNLALIKFVTVFTVLAKMASKWLFGSSRSLVARQKKTSANPAF